MNKASVNEKLMPIKIQKFWTDNKRMIEKNCNDTMQSNLLWICDELAHLLSAGSDDLATSGVIYYDQCHDFYV